MLHDLPRRVAAHPAGRRVLMVIALGFLLTQLFLGVRPWLPGQARARLPWTMFVASGKNNRSLSFTGVTDDGAIIEVDPARWVRFTRGFTGLRVHDHHPAMWKDQARHQRVQRVFARWLARQVWRDDGVRLIELRFQRHWERIESGKVKHGALHSIPIAAEDLERAVPREARVADR